MEVTLAAVADAANRAEGGKLNLLGVFTILYAQQVPCQHPMMSLVLNFEATAMERGTTQKVGIKLVNEDGHALITLPESALAVPNDPHALTPAVNLIVNLNGLMFESYGAYRFDVDVNGETKAQIPIYVRPTGASS
jgi:hypothetical protein